MEELPAYANELKTVDNVCVRMEEDLPWPACQGLCSAQRRKATLFTACWKKADLSF